MNEPTCRIVRHDCIVGNKLMMHSDVFIEQDGRQFYTRYWWHLDDSPHARASEIQQFKDRRQRQGF